MVNVNGRRDREHQRGHRLPPLPVQIRVVPSIRSSISNKVNDNFSLQKVKSRKLAC